jgi:hypothetical protein
VIRGLTGDNKKVMLEQDLGKLKDLGQLDTRFYQKVNKTYVNRMQDLLKILVRLM